MAHVSLKIKEQRQRGRDRPRRRICFGTEETCSSRLVGNFFVLDGTPSALGVLWECERGEKGRPRCERPEPQTHSTTTLVPLKSKKERTEQRPKGTFLSRQGDERGATICCRKARRHRRRACLCPGTAGRLLGVFLFCFGLPFLCAAVARLWWAAARRGRVGTEKAKKKKKKK